MKKSTLFILAALCSVQFFAQAQVWNGTSNPQWTNSNVGIGYATAPTLTEKLNVNGNIRLKDYGLITFESWDAGDYFQGCLSIKGESYSGSFNENGFAAGAIKIAGGSSNSTGVSVDGGAVIIAGGNGNSGGVAGDISVNGGTGITVGKVFLANERGAVGIGTSSVPNGYKLSVLGNSQMQGNLDLTGSLTIPDANKAPGVKYVQIGDDAFFTDYDQPNITGLYGVQNSLDGGIKLGSTGQFLYGMGSKIGIGTTTPDRTLHVAGTARVVGDLNLGTGSGEWLRCNSLSGIELGTGGQSRIRVNYDGTIQIGNKGSATDFKIPQNYSSSYTLAINGTVIAKKAIVAQTWADYVFNSSYNLKSLKETEEYINANKHLPGVPSGEEIEKNGLDTGDMLRVHMEKIEELTLYILQLEKRIKTLEVK